jgi:hypothetical protein
MRAIPEKVAAKAAGLKRYFTGKPCPLGHVAERLVSNGMCVVCHNEKTGAAHKRRRAKNPPRVRCTPQEYYQRYKETRRRWREANPDRVTLAASRWRQRNPEKVLAAQRAWRERNPEKYKSYHAYERRKEEKAAWRAKNGEKWAARARNWRQKNKPRRAAYEATRRAEKRARTLASASLTAIQYFYDWAAHLTETTGVPHEVDHIVPLKGKNVCGLHVEWNLRVIPARENRAKKNALVEELTHLFGR